MVDLETHESQFSCLDSKRSGSDPLDLLASLEFIVVMSKLEAARDRS